MTRNQLESAIQRNQPFSIKMADGGSYPVPHRDYISLPPKSASVIVYDDEGHFNVLPLLTMTGISSKLEEVDQS